MLQYLNQRQLAAELHGGDAGAVGSILKIYWSRWHRSFGELLLDVYGTDALVVDHDGELTWYQRTFLNSRAETIYGGADEIQHNIVGERVLGPPPRTALTIKVASRAHVGAGGDAEDLAGHVPGAVGHEERDGFGDLVGVGVAAERRL